MNSRERYRAITNFQRPDKPFIWTFNIRPVTLNEWLKQGHPQGIRTQELLGYDWFINIPLLTSHYPQYEKIIVEEKDGHVVYYDEEGALRIDRIADQGSGFVTRTWLKFPVASRQDFLKMKERYNPEELGRRGPEYEKTIQQTYSSDYPFSVTLQGFYWTMRQWMGFENLSLAFHDVPDLIDEMLDFILEFNLRLIRKHLCRANIDFLMISEDMAYKTASMVSPSVVKEKFVPRYRELVTEARNAGVFKVLIDCDGHIEELIPLWQQAGIDGTLPVEIAAEQDIVKLAEQYPEFIFIGGIDKRKLSRGKKEIHEEIVPKARNLFTRLGWIPAVDHAVPADAKWDNFKYMIELLKQSWEDVYPDISM